MEELPHISRKISEMRAHLLGWESRRALEMEKMLDENTRNELNELGEHKTLVLELMRLQREGKGLWLPCPHTRAPSGGSCRAPR